MDPVHNVVEHTALIICSLSILGVVYPQSNRKSKSADVVNCHTSSSNSQAINYNNNNISAKIPM